MIFGNSVAGFNVRFTAEDDSFLPFGGTEMECPDLGELVYVNGNTVKTRRWIWRQSEEGKIDTYSNNVIFPIDGFRDRNMETVTAAQEELSRLFREYFNCSISTGMVDADNISFSM